MTAISRGVAALAAALTLALTGCGGTPVTNPSNGNATPAASSASPGGSGGVLEQRRRSAQARADYLALLTEVRAALSAVTPGLRWRTTEPVIDSETGCKTPFDRVPGATIALADSGGAYGGIPDADWARAWSAVKEVAAKHGFGDEHALLDRPGDHQMSVYDAEGAELSVGTGVNTVATIYGACHLA